MRPLEGLPQRHVSTKYGTSVSAFVCEAAGYRLFSPAEDIEIVILARDKKELTRAAKFLKLDLEVSKSIEAVLVPMSQVNFQVANYTPTNKTILEGHTVKPKTTEEEDW